MDLRVPVMGLTTLIVGVLAALVATASSPPLLDAEVAERAATIPSVIAPAARMSTALGATLTVAVLSAIVAAVSFMRERSAVVPIFLAVVLAGEILSSNAIKGALDRPRPDIDQLVGWSGWSFPSGHSAAAAATYLAIALAVSRGDRARSRRWLVAGAVAIALLVAASRVVLGVHWLTDVTAGLALGWGWAVLCSIVILDGPFAREPAVQ